MPEEIKTSDGFISNNEDKSARCDKRYPEREALREPFAENEIGKDDADEKIELLNGGYDSGGTVSQRAVVDRPGKAGRRARQKGYEKRFGLDF